MNYSQSLITAIGDKSNCVSVSEERLNELARRFPEGLVEMWRADGWCSYGNGLFWMVDPDEVTPLLADWPNLPDGSIAFARDSYANVFLRIGDEVQRLNVHYDVLDLVALTTEFFFDLKIHNPKFIIDFLEGKLFRAARRRLGDLAMGECYAFVPPLALGGSKEIDSIKKVRFLEHLAILAQIHGE